MWSTAEGMPLGDPCHFQRSPASLLFGRMRPTLNPLFCLLSLLLPTVLAGCASSPRAAELPPLEFLEAWEKDAPRGAVLVDILAEDEVRSRGIPGAQLLALGSIKPRAAFAGLDPATPVYLYCSNGQGSAQIAKILDDIGFTHMVNLRGGFSAWSAEDLPTSLLLDLNPFPAPPESQHGQTTGEADTPATV